VLRRLLRLPPRSVRDIDAEMREEIDAHIAIGADELVRQGVSPDEALARVRARFGNLDAALPAVLASARRRGRATGRREVLRAAVRDMVFATRQFRRAPLFASGVVLSLGFGIGASATVYSWMQGTVLRPLPVVREADRLVTIRPELRNGFGVSLEEYREWRDQSTTLAGLAAASLSLFAVEPDPTAAGNGSLPIYGMFVSGNYFTVLGVPAAHGRVFTAADDADGAPPVAVVSDAAWRQHFGGDPAVIGRTVRVNGQLVRIVGVTPPHFAGNLAVARFDFWVPLHTRPVLMPSEHATWERRDVRWLDAFGRLRPGVDLTQADAEFRAIASRQAQTFVESRGRAAEATPLDLGEAADLRPLFVGLVIITLMVVLLICSNVANLLLTRASARDREMAVRLSLGASRRRIVRQLMTESLLLAICGAGIGLAIAGASDGFLRFLMPTTTVPLAVTSELDVRFVVFVVGVTGLCVMVFGLAPALLASRVMIMETLKSGASGNSSRGSRLRSSLVVAQFAFALTVLVIAAIFLRRDRDVRAMDLGYRGADRVLLLQTEMNLAGHDDPQRWRATIDRAAERIGQLRGVRSVAVGTFVPLGIMGYARRTVSVPSRPVEPGGEARSLVNGVSPGYFALMGIEVLGGRGFTDADTPGQPPVVVVNEAFAERHFGGQSPLHRRFTLGSTEVEVVGIVRNGRYDYHDIDDDRIPMVYYAWRQAPVPFVTIHVRTDGAPRAMIEPARSAIREVDPGIPLLDPLTLVEYTSVPFSVSRSALKILSVLGAAALALASMGLFSVVSYGVSLRTRELGIRLAVGATPSGILALILRGALRLTLAGAVVGTASAALLATVLRSQVPLLPRAAAPEYAAPALVLALCAVMAGLIPARRAAAVDPSRTLRAD
jgi:predicted permease